MPYADYMLYMKGKKQAVYTSSNVIAQKLEDAGFKRMFYVEGAITSASTDCRLITGKMWLDERGKR